MDKFENETEEEYLYRTKINDFISTAYGMAHIIEGEDYYYCNPENLFYTFPIWERPLTDKR